LILAYSRAEDVAMDVGFYYMANAAGRLAGCLLSGLVYQLAGVVGALAQLPLSARGWLVSLGIAAPGQPCWRAPLTVYRWRYKTCHATIRRHL
jgi:hypothetical protein